MTTKNQKKGGSTSSLNQTFQSQEDIDTLGDENAGADLLEHPSYIELQTKLTEAENKATQYWEKILRMQAEADNAQRRVQRDIENAHKYGLEKFVLELLPSIDSLERAVALPEEHQHSAIEGVNLTLRMLYSALEKFGIQKIDPLGETFNPEFHQAVSTQVDSTVQPNTVVNVLQNGYLLNNRLLRPALVIVSKAS